ncbi:similar to Saccharomyces cerevisiae YJL073W JEM1 DnaJ-like chaperone required for nuclear membrane fusion during mating, localizes to the ER membrane [Maudiozyma barnettii]|uniref:Similar to Saccharomyces cerevisiae YJL073W JEM1 DnaJ-like chaperone required for nuclear membrane fusion during mating, localizes to the ER membrane n=1 Tax=Maudiozyma barnettii TaxID=61262 RepID=A0A8H2VKA8_9SACH|nr:Jem1p [Kazachstania barnettii]CAB4256936.1 similar to Saccharomyces cerevisiae YJL073W JEM1 DnaJ-like chaperone required for nuclear membrane fusion during mating, localizes to the ER membrane [Kazachstania barnettii]CAD1785541.1 similar to Saccharomyces cerevisiae YJL073W JEM1 DnaJ-like chaperone required for nuclear membrane fusion during mating, localizes to the ER membrane [Kazachstania barnettii]
MKGSNLLIEVCLVVIWYYLGTTVAHTENLSDCKLEYFQGLTKDLKRFDNSDLSKYQNVASRLDNCLSDSRRDLYMFKNEIYYKIGLIHLSMGNDMKGMNAFEELKDLGDSYYNLSKDRLSDLYTEFGLWDRLKLLLPDDDTGDIFRSLNSTLHEKINDPSKLSTINDELVPMLNISPYDINTLTIRADFLFHQLIESENFNDLTAAYEIARIYETILEKHKITLSLDKRIQMHYTISLLQLLILNIEPTQHIRKCLAIDMDYKPCKDLSLLVSRLSKINPTRAQLLDTETYVSKTDIDWNKVIDYYMTQKRDGIINYEWINSKIVKLINDNTDLLVTNRAATNHLFETTKKGPLTVKADHFAFFKYLDIILCQANMELSLTKGKDRDHYKKDMDRFCKKTLKETLTPEEWDNFINVLNKKDAQISEEFMNKIWNMYPTLSIYMIGKIISRKTFKQFNGQLQDLLIKFFNDNSLFNTMNPFIQKEASVIQKIQNKKQKLNEQRQRQRQQQQQQQQQRQFFQQFGQQQQHQQRAPPPPPAHNTDKDYYKILNVPKESNSKEIRKAYLNLTKKYHPDKQGSLSENDEKKIHEKMSEINEAYEILSDDNKRSDYDNSRNGGSGGGHRQQGNGNDWFNFQSQGNPFPFGNMRGGF